MKIEKYDVPIEFLSSLGEAEVMEYHYFKVNELELYVCFYPNSEVSWIYDEVSKNRCFAITHEPLDAVIAYKKFHGQDYSL